MKLQTTLTTDHVTLRPLTESDLILKVKWYNDPAVRKTLVIDEVFDLAGTQGWFARLADNESRCDFMVESTDGAPFSVLSIGSLDGSEATRIIEVPGLLSFLGTGDWEGRVEGIDDLRESEREMAQRVVEEDGAELAPYVQADSYAPVIPLAYWTFRLTMGFGFLTILLAAAALWATRGTRVPLARWWTLVAVLAPLSPVLANSFGWIFTETGRQPWVVYGLMTTQTAVSPSVSVGEVWFSMVVYTLLYAALAVVEVKLFLTYVRKGAEEFVDPRDQDTEDDDAPLQFAY